MILTYYCPHDVGTFICNPVPFFNNQEDPRLKYPVHMRNKNSMDPGDLGPLPVSMAIIRLSAYLSIRPQRTLMN